MTSRVMKFQNFTAEPSPLHPPLKWAGGKRWLVPIIREFWRHFLRDFPVEKARLVEPFCGGLSVALGLLPRRALLNDINPHLINFYIQIRDGLRITMEMENDRELYYTYRARFNSLVREGRSRSKEAAQLFYFLNRTGYNGLCRFNRKGEFNVPFGSYKRINYRRDFSPYAELFKNWEFRCGDFEELELSENDFIYADPPYDVEFRSYSPEGFAWEDQVRLARWLSSHGGPVLLSNQYTERVAELYADLGFHLIELSAPRRISSDGNREPAREILAVKNISPLVR